MCVPPHLCRNSEGYKLICAVHHQKLKLELTWQPGTTQNYFESCFQFPLGSTQNVTHWGRSRRTHVSPAVGLGSFWMQGHELLACGPAVVKGASLSRARLEEIILKAQDKWSILPRPLTAAWPDHTGIFLPNRHMNGGGTQLETASQQSKQEHPYRAGKKYTFCSAVGAKKKCIINNWKGFQRPLNTISRNWNVIGFF